MNFGEAIEAMKNGKAVRRSGWNGKGMFLYLNKGASYISEPNHDVPGAVTHIEEIRVDLFEKAQKDTIRRLPNINMTAATGSTVTGWLASQTDMLAEDWEILTLNGIEV